MEIEKHIEDFKKSILKKYEQNDINLIYLRLSTIDNTAENPITETMNKLKSDFDSIIFKYQNLKREGFTIFIEVKSAYKNSTRDEFINMYNNYLFKDLTIQNILENTNINQTKKSLYISSYDRLSRVFLNSLLFQLIRKSCNIDIYTLIDSENNLELTSKNIYDQDSTQQVMYVFQLMMFSSMAMKHSEDLSNKIKKRVIKENGITISSKSGNKWGAHKSISQRMETKILNKHIQGYTNQEISDQVDIYQVDKNNKKKRISPHTIRSIIARSKSTPSKK